MIEVLMMQEKGVRFDDFKKSVKSKIGTKQMRSDNKREYTILEIIEFSTLNGEHSAKIKCKRND